MRILIILGAILFIVFIKAHSRHKKPLRAAVISMVPGVLSLVLIAPVISLPVNVYTVFVSLTLGIAGTALTAIGSVLV